MTVEFFSADGEGKGMVLDCVSSMIDDHIFC